MSWMKFILIDGNAIMHRAYHALPPLTASDGRATNAVYGFTSMLLRIINDLHPTHLAVAFDRPEPTFRKKLLVSYQAHRPEMEDSLSSQFPIMQDVLSAMRIPIFEHSGYEADDVIGTIANKVKSEKLKVKRETSPKSPPFEGGERGGFIDEIIIVTGDRDILQLVDEQVNVYMPVKGLSEAKMYDREAVFDKMGIYPQQIVDYKALVGDASDNYPGISGIGPKTAMTLLGKYKTLEQVYKNLGKEKNKKIVERLKNGEKDAEMAKTLAQIVKDVPVKVDMELCLLHEFDSPEVEELFHKLGFKSLLGRIKGEEKEKEGKEANPSTPLRINPSTVAQDKKKKEDDSQLSFF